MKRKSFNAEKDDYGVAVTLGVAELLVREEWSGSQEKQIAVC